MLLDIIMVVGEKNCKRDHMLFRPLGISFVCESTLEAKLACGGMYSGNLLCCSYKFLLSEDLKNPR